MARNNPSAPARINPSAVPSHKEPSWPATMRLFSVNPESTSTRAARSPSMRKSPAAVSAQTVPCASSNVRHTCVAGTPCSGPNASTLPPRMRAKPPDVLIQSTPVRPSIRSSTRSLGIPVVFARVIVLNSTPSNRTSPPSVAIHRNPSRPCTMACTVFCGRPVSVCHDWYPY